ncbi:MAG TPA: hypothetical protein VIH95_10075 [Acidimicrobiales bacterium]
MRRYLTPRCLGLHATLLVLLLAFAWLTSWQYSRATGGNSLSWAYVFLWPAFAVYAVYTWWNLVQDQVTRHGGAGGAQVTTSVANVPEAAPGSRPPGWALTGGRKQNVAIAASAPIDAERGGKGERFTAQTPEEAARLAEYNRYLATLANEDADAGPGAGR